MNTDHDQRFDAHVFAIAQDRMKSCPLNLTAQDLDQLAIISPALEAEAREAIRQAQLAIVAPHMVAPRVHTKSVELSPTELRGAAPRKSDVDTWDQFVERYGAKKVSVQMLDTMLTTFKKALIERDTKFSALEQRNKTLEDRILELEATKAAQLVPRDDR